MKIVCMGDSLTRGHKVKRNEGWVNIKNKSSHHQWINAGISGDTSGGMLARLSTDCFNHKPDCLLLMGGTNDFIQGTGLSIVKANVSAIIHQSVHRNIKPHLLVPLLVDSSMIQDHWNNRIQADRLNQELKAYRDWLIEFSQLFSFPLIDLQTIFKKASRDYGTQALYLDGLHPTALGHEIIAENILLSLCR